MDFFTKSYIISLPERRDRRKAMTLELKRIGISLPASTQIAFFPAVKPPDQGDFPSVGARGCFLSHLAVLTEARDQGLKNVLIMEDDLSFTSTLARYQNEIIAKLANTEWDIVYLGHEEPLESRATVNLQPFFGPVMKSHFLAINGRTLEKVVTFFETVLSRPSGHPLGGPMHVDGAYSTFRQQNPDIITLLATPIVGFQRPSPSDIAQRHVLDKLPSIRRLLGVGRKARLWYIRRGHSSHS
jgi:hypothetical protein